MIKMLGILFVFLTMAYKCITSILITSSIFPNTSFGGATFVCPHGCPSVSLFVCLLVSASRLEQTMVITIQGYLSVCL